MKDKFFKLLIRPPACDKWAVFYSEYPHGIIHLRMELINNIMTEYELDKICEKQKDCGCKCMQCELFAKYMRNKENDRF